MQPNIILVIADDMRWDFLQYATRMNQWADGRCFINARCNIGLCGPFRMSIMTGQKVENHRNPGNGDTQQYNHDDFLQRWIKNAGYRTMFCGKYMNGDSAADRTPHPLGWDEWYQFVEEGSNGYQQVGYGVNDGTSVTTPDDLQMHYIRNKAIAFIQNGDPEPFYLHLTPTAPHLPFSAILDDVHRFGEVRSPYSSYNADTTGKPSWITAQPNLSTDKIAKFHASAISQAREVQEIDKMLADIQAAMTPTQYANTVVLFTSDNGMSYGEFKLPLPGFVKNDLYEHSIHVPLMARGPGFTKGVTNIEVYSDVDVIKTIVDIAGATPLLSIDGTDLRAIVTNAGGIYTNRSTVHYRGGGGDINPNINAGWAITTPTQKLIRWSGCTGTDRYEMYERTGSDAVFTELTNVAYDGGKLADRNALEALINTEFPIPSTVPVLLDAGGTTTNFVPGTGANLTTSAINGGLNISDSIYIDVVATNVGAVDDIVLTGDCLGVQYPLGSNSQIDGLVFRKIFRIKSRYNGLPTPIVITSSTDQALTSLHYVVTAVPFGNEPFQTVSDGGTSSVTTRGVTMGALNASNNSVLLTVVKNATSQDTPDDGGILLYENAGLTEPNVRITTTYKINDTTPSVSGAATTVWSAIGTEIGI